MITPLWLCRTSKGGRFLSALLIVVCISTMMGQHVYGETAYKGTVKCKSGIVRENASQTSACAFCVKEGEAVYVLSEEKTKDGTVWYRISLQNSVGYIRSDLIRKSDEKVDITLTSEEKTDEKPASETQEENKEENKQESKTASVKGTSVRIRSKEVVGSVVCQLNEGHTLTILEENTADDSNLWYKVSFEYDGQQKEGYVRSDLVNLTATSTSSEPVALSDEEFEKAVADFPEDYKVKLRTLHATYPNWKFVAVDTGLNWDDVVENESVIGKNLTSKSSVASWKSTAPQAYNSSTGEWYGFDGGAWAAASKDIIKYYLDPRNFMDASGIFQFETLEYQDYQNEEGLGKLLVNSFMGGSYTDTDGVTRSYANTFLEAGKEYGVNPYHLASRCLQEQGLYGKSDSISGTVPGYENLFNYFNIGAYAASGNSAEINGLIYASGSDEDMSRPWNSRKRSIMGSTKYISEKYIKKGQNTLYFQKFNVVNKENGIYAHQYMNNICAAAIEGARMKNAYDDPNSSLVFRIPVYGNMPESPCAKPGTGTEQ